MRKVITHAVTTVIASTAAIFIAASPASAAQCPGGSWRIDAYLNSTQAWNLNNSQCHRVEARIDRYYASTIYQYTSGWWFNFADTGSHTDGYNAGNAGRSDTTDGAAGSWVWV